MRSKAFYPVVAVVGIVAASAAAWWFQKQPEGSLAQKFSMTAAKPAASAPQAAASGPRPTGVEIAKAEVAKLTDDAQAVGSLKSRQSVIVRPEVSGRIATLNFRDGDRVRKGQLLVQFDDQLQLAQIKQSQAELSISQANHKRNQELVEQNFISRRSVEESAANVEVALARLALSQAAAARLKIIAPFDGMTGIRSANPGDYLKDGADIVNIEDIEVVYVDFRLPERFQSKIRRGQTAAIDLDALPGRKFTAIVQAVDPQVDANGRSVNVRGCIDNRQSQLRPGMFARVNLVFATRDHAVVVPEEALVPQGGRLAVFRLVDGPEAGSKVTQRVEIKVGLRRPGRVEILEGLAEGDTVVVAGHQRLQRDGQLVRIIETARAPRGAGLVEGAPAGAASAPRASASQPQLAGSAPAQARVAGAQGGAGGGARPRAGPSAQMQGPNPCLAEMADDPGGRAGRAGPGGAGGGSERRGPGGGAPGGGGARPPAATPPAKS